MLGKFCAVSPECDRVTMVLPDKSGVSHEITLSFDEASSLAMTLPRLLTTALSRQFGDVSLRHAYPVQEYKVECASDHRHILLTLSVTDGFDIVFALDVGMIPAFTRDLCGGQALLETTLPPLPN